MHSINDITQIFNAPHGALLELGSSNKYLGRYNKLLSGLFEESPFLVIFPRHNCMEIVLHTRRIRYLKCVLLLLVLEEGEGEEESWDEDRMKTLLTEADTLDIPTIHGICVRGTRVAFYGYEREQGLGVVTGPEGLGDLREEEGAGGVVEVAEDVKRMCRGLVEKLKF
jgi:hypothetical protein